MVTIGCIGPASLSYWIISFDALGMVKFVLVEEQTFPFGNDRYYHIKVGGDFNHVRDVRIFARVSLTFE